MKTIKPFVNMLNDLSFCTFTILKIGTILFVRPFDTFQLTHMTLLTDEWVIC